MRNSGIKKNHKIYIFKHQQAESGGGGGANLEDNKTATIDVSAYTGPVAINPTAGKDGMKKTTVTLSNIPSGGDYNFYCWSTSGLIVFTVSDTPSIGDNAYKKGEVGDTTVNSSNPYEITAVGEGTITVTNGGQSAVLSRGSAYDISFSKSST